MASLASPGVASSPRAEALRRVTALGRLRRTRRRSWARSRACAAAVFAPDASPRFRAGGALASHAAIMALTMRPTATTATKKKGSVDEEEEDAEAACAKLLAPMLVGEEESLATGRGVLLRGGGVGRAGAPGAGLPPREGPRAGLRASDGGGFARAFARRANRRVAREGRAAWARRGPVDATLRPPPPRTRRPSPRRARARGRTAAARADAAERKATASDEEEEEEEAMYHSRGRCSVGVGNFGFLRVAPARTSRRSPPRRRRRTRTAAGRRRRRARRRGSGGRARGGRGGEGRRAEAEKAREAAAAALRAIKEIVGAAEGGGGTRKCD